MTGLRYNDWYLVVCLKADAATMHLRYIVNNMMWSIAGLIAAVALVSAAMILFWVRVQSRISLEQQRYLLLEHFSDTVLFDYDCRHDTIRFASNASKLLKIRELTQNHFLNGLGPGVCLLGRSRGGSACTERSDWRGIRRNPSARDAPGYRRILLVSGAVSESV